MSKSDRNKNNKKEETLSVKGKDITMPAQVRVCGICHEEVFDEELDSKTLDAFYREYRKSEKLLLPEEIKSIRLKYRLSQSSFAKVLGFGEKTITRYENGAIQDVCHDNLIRLMDSMGAFVSIWENRKDCLSAKEQTRVESIVKAYDTRASN